VSMSRSGRDIDVESEWNRVVQNPDNMLVSDAISGAVRDLLKSREDSASSTLTAPFASLSGSDFSISIAVNKFETSSSGWVISGTSLLSACEQFMSVDRSKWKKISIFQAKSGEVLWHRDLDGSKDLKIELQFVESSATCIVTLSCTSPSIQTRVL